MGILYKIQDDVMKYAEIISNITGVDVEVMDNNFVRVAGTGIFKSKVNQNMKQESFAYQKVLKSGKPTVIMKPREDEICIDCPIIDTCTETFEISTPIYFEGNIIGIIGMMSNNLKSKDIISTNLDNYLKFLNKISEFITSKAKEYADSQLKENSCRSYEKFF